MERLDRIENTGAMSCTFGLGMHVFINFLILVLLTVCIFSRSGTVSAEEKESIAVLPFRVHSLKPLDHLKSGLQEMLVIRLERRGFKTASVSVVNEHPLAFLPVFETKDFLILGKDLDVEWVVSGSLTEVGGKVSVDLKVVDVSQVRSPFSIFMVSENIEAVADTIGRLAASIDYQISEVPQIDSVLVKGNQRIEKDAVLAVISTKKGDMLDFERLDRDLRDIYRMGFFKDVEIDIEEGSNGKIVIFNVVEKPSIGKIVFEGNDDVNDDDLKKELGIKTYSILDPNEIKQGLNRLKEFYREKGYYNIEISESTTELPNNEVLVKYEIEEGEKVYVEEIKFHGNKEFDNGDLKNIMETDEKGLFSWITKSGVLDRKKLEFDVQKITSFYHSKGFLKARVGQPEVTYEKDKGLIISIEVHEGPKYGVRNVSIEGDLVRPADELMKEVRISEEEVFNRETLRKGIFTLRDIYADEGYAYADVTPIVTEDDEKHVVDVTFRISKGQEVRFERINITGNTVTRDKVIRRELKVIEGGVFSGKDLKRSTENLNRLGYFEEVDIQKKKGNAEDLMILDIGIKERPTGSFSVGAGYSSADSTFVSLQIAQRNFRGYGQTIAASAKVGIRSNQFDVAFVEPWLFDKPISAGVRVYKWEQEYYEYIKDSLGGSLTFGFPLGIDDFTRGSVQYAYDDADISDLWQGASLELRDMEGRTVTSSMNFTIKRDSKDKPWNTTKGSINSLSFEYAGGILGGDAYFNRYIARSAWYFPFPWDTVLVAQGRWGYMKKRSGGRLPIFQKFRLGGIDSVRGFDYASISPLDPATGDRIGGEKMMVYNLEYRFPVLRDQGVVGLVFFDAGNVFTKHESYSFSGIRRSVGTGIRWYSPVGPLRLEYGWNLDPRYYESSGGWEFTVGGSF